MCTYICICTGYIHVDILECIYICIHIGNFENMCPVAHSLNMVESPHELEFLLLLRAPDGSLQVRGV